MVYRIRDIEEVLPELARHVFISRVDVRKLKRNRQHVQAVHPHPARPVCLLDVAARGERRAAIKYAYVVESQKTALKYVAPLGVLSIHPPRKVEHQLMKNALKEYRVAAARPPLVDLIDAPCRPGVNRRVHIPQGPFVRWQL